MKNKKYSINRDFEYDNLWPADHQSATGKKQTASFPWSERHLQCVWFASEFRPQKLFTAHGEPVIVQQPGRWNLEKGPDFLGAVLLVGAERHRISGDVEVHIHPGDWPGHDHSSDPAYARVIAHITYFPGLLPSRVLPPGVVQIALKENLDNNPFFSFEAIDVTGYPFAAPQANTPCSSILSRWNPDRISGLLAGAGKYRLERKAERLSAAAARKGNDQVLYEEIMSALGYKHNRLPFRQLAERVPLEALHEDAGLNPDAAYALLAGVAGLLPPVTRTSWDEETRRFVRKLWNHWWKLQARWSGRIMPPESWRLSNVRPQNHPRRRLMAAARLFGGKKNPGEQIAGLHVDNPRNWLDRVLDIIQSPADEYWRRRLAIGGRPASKDTALVGDMRAAAIVSNVVVPFAIGPLNMKLPLAELYDLLPPEEDNAVIRQSAFNLLGRDHNPALYRNGLLQQGLIQVFHDFCLSDRSSCTECGLAEMIKKQD
jgi:hypothetical protein